MQKIIEIYIPKEAKTLVNKEAQQCAFAHKVPSPLIRIFGINF